MSKSQRSRRPFRRRSWRSRKSLALVFALVFAPAGSRTLSGACLELGKPPAISATSDGAIAAIAADLDGDGDADVVAAAQYDGTLVWFDNDGGGAGWTPHTIFASTPSGVSAVAVADLDDDGDLDVAAAAANADLVAWFANDGSGGGWTLHTVASGTAADDPRALSAADVDGDGAVDLLATSHAGPVDVVWFDNDGTGGGWTAHAISNNTLGPWSVVGADLDGDGDLDALAGSGAYGRIEFHESSGDGLGWTLHVIATQQDGVRSVFAADLDGDGDLDALSTSYSVNQIAWHENSAAAGDGSTWATHLIDGSVSGPRGVAAADLDGDGDADVLAAAPNEDALLWYENDGAGGGWTVHSIATQAGFPFAVTVADLDADGDPDPLFVARDGDKVVWLRNDRPHGTALFGGAQTVAADLAYPASVRAGDVDGDGDLDLVSQSADFDFVAWYANDGSGSGWTEMKVETNAAGALFSAPADVDGDGDLDVVSAAWGNRTAWHENVDALVDQPGSGNGSAWSLHTVTNGTNTVTQLATADVDGDGDLDLLSASASPSQSLLAWHVNADPFQLTDWTTITISASVDQVTSVVASDLDRDGDVDAVASVSGAPERISWFENTAASGNGSTWSERTIVALADPENVVLGDVDRDGDDDVVAALSGGFGAIVWYENPRGAGSWAAHTAATGSALLASTDVAVTDFDRDGDLDILAASFYAPRVAWIENLDGAGGSWTSHVLSTVDDVTHLVAADLDSDGDDDAAVAGRNGDRLDWYENRSSHVFTNGLDSESNDAAANLACWSANSP